MHDPDTSLADELKTLTASDEKELTPNDARKKAMDLLARREHARGELLKKLAKAGFDETMALDAIEQLRSENLQSDRRFCESFVQSRFGSGKGPARIRAELRERDVAESLADEALSDFDGDWFALAVEVREKKFGLERPADFKEKAKQMRFLQYRGFEQSHIAVAVGDD